VADRRGGLGGVARSRPLGVAAALVLAAGAAGAYVATKSAPVRFRLATVSRASVVQSLVSQGAVTPVNEGTVSFPVAGTVAQRSVVVGSHVHAGQTLAVLDTASLQQGVAAAAAVLATDEARVASDQNGQAAALSPVAARTTSPGPPSTRISGSSTGTTGAASLAAVAGLAARQAALRAAQATADRDLARSALFLRTAEQACGAPSGAPQAPGTPAAGGRPTTGSAASSGGHRTRGASVAPSATQAAGPPSPTPTPSGPVPTPSAGPTSPAPTSPAPTSPAPTSPAPTAPGMPSVVPSGPATGAPSGASSRAGAGSPACLGALQGSVTQQERVSHDQQALSDAISQLADRLSAALLVAGRGGGTSGAGAASGPAAPAGAGAASGTRGTSTGAPSGTTAPGGTAPGGTGTGGASRTGGAPPAAAGSGTGAISAASGASAVGVPSALQLAADQAAVDAANADVRAATQQLARATLTSPLDGTVAAIGFVPGQRVGAGSSTATVVVVAPGGEQASASVSDADVDQVRVGLRALITPAAGGAPLDGTVTAIGLIGQASSSGSVSYPVTIAVGPGARGLPNGAAVSVAIQVRQVNGVLTVPSSAIRSAGTRSVVQVLRTGKSTPLLVTVGAQGALRSEIRSGLAAGDQVILADLSTPLPTATTKNLRGLRGGGRGGAGGITVPKGGAPGSAG